MESNLEILFSEDIKNLNDNLFVRSNMNTLILSNIDQIPLKFQKQFLFLIENSDFFSASNIVIDHKIITISVKNINGPITIAQVAGETAAYGLEVYLGFLALLSISLGVLNLLPIPVLDGGQILFCFIELIIRRPVPEKVQAWSLQLGLLIISSIMVLAIYNDFNRFLYQ